jgi:hypothetical protein
MPRGSGARRPASRRRRNRRAKPVAQPKPEHAAAPPPPSPPSPPLPDGQPVKSADSRETVWSRRNILIGGVIGGLTLAVSGAGVYWAMRSTGVAERADARDQKVFDWQMPPMSGAPIRYRVLQQLSGPDLMALPSGVRTPDWFAEVHEASRRKQWILDNGGAWVSGLSFRLVVESLRRSVILQSVSVRFLRRDPVLDGTIVMGHPLGGGDVRITEISTTSADLDAERPVLREPVTDSGAANSLGAPFPTKQITLDSHGRHAIDVRAQARRFSSEWELMLDVLADDELLQVPIRADGKLFRTTGPATAYQVGLAETGESEDLSAGRGRLEPKDPAQILRHG